MKSMTQCKFRLWLKVQDVKRCWIFSVSHKVFFSSSPFVAALKGSDIMISHTALYFSSRYVEISQLISQ